MARKKFEMLISPLDVTIPTWLAVGALLQMLLMLILPRAGVTLLPIFYILYRVIKVFRDSRAINTKTFTSVKRGRWTAELPVEGSTIPEEVICMVLAARINQYTTPRCRAPGFAADTIVVRLERRLLV